VDIQKLANDAMAKTLRYPSLPIGEVVARVTAEQIISECIDEVRATPCLTIVDPDILKERICARLIALRRSVKLP